MRNSANFGLTDNINDTPFKVNFAGSNYNRGQVTGYVGFRVGNVSAGHNNDLYFKIDQYHGANINLKIGIIDKPNLAIWNDMYNGRRVNYGPNKTGTTPSPLYWHGA